MGFECILQSDLNENGWGLRHETPRRLLEPMIGESAIWYTVYRTVTAAYMTSTFIAIVVAIQNDHSLTLLHFPLWGYAVTVINNVLFAIYVYKHHRLNSKSKVLPMETAFRPFQSDIRRYSRRKKARHLENEPSLPLSLKVIWVTYYISLFSAFATLVCYCTGLFKGQLQNVSLDLTLFNADEIMLHLVISIYTFLDFWITGIKIRLLHFYISLAYAIFYNLILAVVTVVEPAVSTSHRVEPLYDVADFNSIKRSTTSAMFVFCFALFLPIAIHIVFYLLFIVRLYLYDHIVTVIQIRLAAKHTSTVQIKAEDSKVKHRKDGSGGKEEVSLSAQVGGSEPIALETISETQESEGHRHRHGSEELHSKASATEARPHDRGVKESVHPPSRRGSVAPGIEAKTVDEMLVQTSRRQSRSGSTAMETRPIDGGAGEMTARQRSQAGLDSFSVETRPVAGEVGLSGHRPGPTGRRMSRAESVESDMKTFHEQLHPAFFDSKGEQDDSDVIIDPAVTLDS